MTKKSAVLWLLAVCILVGGLVAAIPSVIGWKFEATFREFADELTSSPAFPFVVKVTEYNRTGSKAYAKTSVRAKYGAFAFDLEHQLSHWPSSHPFAVTITSTPRFHGDVQANLDYYYAPKQIFEADTSVNFGGSFDTHIKSPAVDRRVARRPELRVRTEAVSSSITVTPSKEVTVTLDAPHLLASDYKDTFEVRGIKLDGRWSLLSNLGLISGDSELRIGGATAKLTSDSLESTLKELGLRNV